MKKKVSILICLMTLVFLMGCSGGNTGSPDSSDVPEATEPDYTPPVLPANVGENPFAGKTWWEPDFGSLWVFSSEKVSSGRGPVRDNTSIFRYTYNASDNTLYRAYYKWKGFTAEEYLARTPEQWASIYNQTLEEFEASLASHGISSDDSLSERTKAFVKKTYLPFFDKVYSYSYEFDDNHLILWDYFADGRDCLFFNGVTICFNFPTGPCFYYDKQFELTVNTDHTFSGTCSEEGVQPISGSFTLPVVTNGGRAASFSLTVENDSYFNNEDHTYDMTWTASCQFNGVDVENPDAPVEPFDGGYWSYIVLDGSALEWNGLGIIPSKDDVQANDYYLFLEADSDPIYIEWDGESYSDVVSVIGDSAPTLDDLNISLDENEFVIFVYSPYETVNICVYDRYNAAISLTGETWLETTAAESETTEAESETTAAESE